MDSYTPPEMQQESWMNRAAGIKQRKEVDRPIITFEDVFGYIQLFLASVGIVAIALFAGLYASGFFHWLSTKMPDSKVLAFLFG
ncbi:hypothetical protein UFOVP275_47 [uncultured Caudovirales phage]|uniref:Uncharacterized protein n=1 Tax=uncultured Caudovirales phage TaxID=2100421 RepID=A0A6J5LK86_9CAUD|nr:hypothetical protein UFOVP275_47 [uncultured Caudovirales phage]